MALGRFDPRPRGFMLAADDFGLTRGVNRAILGLAGAGRLTAIGSMTNMPSWLADAVGLRELDGKVDLGVHLNLTLGAPLGAMARLAPSGSLPPLAKLMGHALTLALPQKEIEAEWVRQINAFERKMGRLPDYLDAHQHVHVLPGLRGCLLRVIAKLWRDGPPPWVRDPYDTPGAILARGVARAKASVIAGLSLGWRQRLAGNSVPSNHGFSGFSPFDPNRDFAKDFRQFLIALGPAHLVMCHPGAQSDTDLAALDPVIATRPLETAYLGSSRFSDDLSEARLELWRAGDLIHASAAP